jgi:flagellar assembly protein FliH
MSDVLTPKDKLTAYERWELPSFDAGGGIRVSGNPNGIKLPTASELEAIERQAHDEGFQAGYAEGMQKATAENQRFATLLASLEQQVDQQVSQSLLDLALELAQQMLHQALKVDPELLLEIVRDAIATLPHFNPGAHIFLHPDDAEIVRTRLGEQLAHSGWKIFEDAHITRGGARIETSHSQIDATVETRWKRITANIGQDSSWLQS